jgi:putative DNA primase/helicase
MTTTDHATTMQAFLAAIEAAGIHPLEPIAERLALGQFVRFRAQGDKPGRKNGWALLFLDGLPTGQFGHHRLDIRTRWKLNGGTSALTPAERDAIAKRIKKMDAERENRRDRAAAVAVDDWTKARPADPSHSYLMAKGLGPFGIKQLGPVLLIPMWDCHFRLRNHQRILIDGSKLFLIGGETAGLFWHHGILNTGGQFASHPLVIAEGYATAAAIHEATGYPVVAAMSGKNLAAVSEIMRKRFPSREIIIAADYDGHLPKNNGVLWAEMSAHRIGAKVAYPVEMAWTEPKVRGGIDFADIPRAEAAAFIEIARKKEILSRGWH